jgi:hypothetical protein
MTDSVSGTNVTGRATCLEVRPLAAQISGEKVLGLDHAEHPVQPLIRDREPRLSAFEDLPLDLRPRIIRVDPDNIRPRDHDGTHIPVGQPHDTAHHALFFKVDDAAGRALVQDGVDFFLSHRFLPDPRQPQQAEQARRSKRAATRRRERPAWKQTPWAAP